MKSETSGSHFPQVTLDLCHGNASTHEVVLPETQGCQVCRIQKWPKWGGSKLAQLLFTAILLTNFSNILSCPSSALTGQSCHAGLCHSPHGCCPTLSRAGAKEALWSLHSQVYDAHLQSSWKFSNFFGHQEVIGPRLKMKKSWQK